SVSPGAGEVLPGREALDYGPLVTIPGEAIRGARLRDAGSIHESALRVERRVDGEHRVMIAVPPAGAVHRRRKERAARRHAPGAGSAQPGLKLGVVQSLEDGPAVDRRDPVVITAVDLVRINDAHRRIPAHVISQPGEVV